MAGKFHCDGVVVAVGSVAAVPCSAEVTVAIVLLLGTMRFDQ